MNPGPGLQDLSIVMKGVLSVPHSSAACERIFSMVRNTCTVGRSATLQDTTEALLVMKGNPAAVWILTGSCQRGETRQLSGF